MGGTTFCTTPTPVRIVGPRTDTFRTYATMDEAYSAAVNDALWEKGHGGYTGTIAEKDGFVDFGVSKIDPGQLARLIEEALYGRDGEREAEARVGLSKALDLPPRRTIDEVLDTYDDKWGPAVGVRFGDEFWFMGWAST